MAWLLVELTIQHNLNWDVETEEAPLMASRRSFLETTGAALAATAVSPAALGALSATTRALDELVDYDTIGLSELIRSGQISQPELVEIVIRRIEALQPILNFMTTPTFEQARGKAGNIPNESAFAGVPILMKDMIDVGGVRRTDGSALLATNVPEKNVDYTDAVEAAGLNIVGMTNVPEFAGGLTCDNNMFGETRNPWNLDFSPMISSGGSAAAAAAGVVPLVHGTDGPGSNRLPASACGLFGVKPSRFRMLSGEAGGGHDRTKTNQTMSRTVRDGARLMDLTEDKSGKH
ncbi:MAG: amidase family protein, partial [Geminicoccaceae bacterium]